MNSNILGEHGGPIRFAKHFLAAVEFQELHKSRSPFGVLLLQAIPPTNPPAT